jgi:tRNA A-37 threonylcarbamoyl transferase component Bud32
MSEVSFGREAPKMMEDAAFDPKRFLVLPSKKGFMRLCDATSIEEFVAREGSFGNKSVEINKLGGVINNVYLLSFRRGGETLKVVAKKFEEWADLKWIPLAMWAIGAQNFSVRAKVRLARECAANLYLRQRGFAASALFQVSWEKSLLFKEFVDGQRLDELIIGLVRAGVMTDGARSMLWGAGKVLAEVHGTGFTIGDNKPENIIVHHDGRVFFVDLEQAGKGGNMVWDLAEFLYYLGHYVLPTDSMRGVVDVVSSFVEGYVAGGGSVERVRRVRSARYVNKFVPFVLPGALLEIRNALEGLC